MIKVEKLTKRYAGVTAINNLDFEVEKGEIVGFLGPNGAGKSTTMKILTGYLPATSGSASIAGFDVFEQSIEARKRLGYLPENTPLYTDMRVSEYLRYRANLKGVAGRKVRQAVGDVLELCNLREVEHKLIGRSPRGIVSAWAWPMRSSTTPPCSFSMNRPSASTRTRFARSAS
ncbi:ABC-type multidrug transport system ATPase component-like protein [Chthoniobacter flavus Ellin428]|uniref:ABC-type multidrug transport system ATPase component-like protein n=1 Tax=Chthoniobacter flavus Ellin428 TaxID=497964 RepID=B4D064_9BACT|nr:ATP-binding cassette domain-containing protein [Chthoniobacter flavus]EDY20378.1 ABC-type multidrug transport system ATPase component-like protein [Chthoniobacter flavus Ellin428]